MHKLAELILGQFTKEELEQFKKEENVACLCWDCVLFGDGIAEKLMDRLDKKLAAECGKEKT